MSIDFKNEKEVKEYLENLGIEYRYGCFSEKNPEACHLLGDYLDAIKKDYQKAARVYKANCDDYNFPKSCHQYGNYALTGKGPEKQDELVAYEYYLKACELNVPASCFNAGMMSVSKDPDSKREKDYTKGIQLLNKGCDLNHPNSCYILSGLYITGSKDNSLEKDMKRAFKYSEKACDLDNIYACVNLSIMYKRGEGVEKNEELSAKFKNKAEELIKEQKSRQTIEFQRV